MKNLSVVIMIFFMSSLLLYGQYRVTSSVFGEGIAVISNSNFVISSTVGQPIIGKIYGNGFNIKTGLWESLQVKIIQQETPVLNSPSNGESDVSVSPTLNWNSFNGAESYQLQVATDILFSSLIFDQSGITATSQKVSGLMDSTTYYWHVRAVNFSSNYTEFSETWYFKTKNQNSKNVLFADDFNSINDWVTKVYKGKGSFTKINYQNESCAQFYMDGSPGVMYTYKQLENTIPAGSKLTAKWFYETSGIYSNSENSDGGYIRFLDAITAIQPSDQDVILSLFMAHDYPMHQWNVKEFNITKDIPAGSYISIGGAVWPSYIINNWDYIKIQSSVTDVTSKDKKMPEGYILRQNYPNPFNPVNVIKYQVPRLSFVTLKVYDVLGNEKATLVNEGKPAGEYEVEFNSGSLPSGVYFYRLTAGTFSSTKKLLLLK